MIIAIKKVASQKSQSQPMNGVDKEFDDFII